MKTIYYHGVRKVEWDNLWHALYKNRSGRDTWDRVTPKRAREIFAALLKGKPIEVGAE